MTTPSVAIEATSLSPVALFMHADIIGKGVILGLLLASIWVWMIIIGSIVKLRKARNEAESFEREFWRAGNVDQFGSDPKKADTPSGRILAAGLAEWRRSTSRPIVDREGVRERIAMALDSAIGSEVDRLSDRLNILATVGSVAPFVGLFGTVWGIMRSFSEIASKGNTSLTVVAPGITEALFATAIGLFAAIPAVIAYNRLSFSVGKLEARFMRFADGFHAMLSRELERE